MCSNCKVVNLAHEDNTVTMDCTGVETWLVYSGNEANVSKDGVGVFFPESWGLWVSLHCRIDGDYMSVGYGWAAFVDGPPFNEFPIRADKESLFR